MADVTRDHVPPRNLFPDPPPPNLITVPACSSCNTGSSTHDEYLRAALALTHDLSSNPAVVAIRPKVQRALAMPEKKGLKTSIHGTLRNVVLLSPSGRQLGTQQTYDVNLDRLLRVVARTTAGLFWKFQRRCIRSGYLVGAQLESELNFSGAPETAEQIGVLRNLDPVVAYENVYSARAFRSHEDHDTTVWWHTFYEKVSFLAATLPPRENDVDVKGAV